MGVKKFSKPLTERNAGIDSGRQWWGDSEMSVLFKHPTLLPFDDHDMIRKNAFDLSKEHGQNAGGPLQYYPLALSFAQGSIGRPNLEATLWIERACHAVLAAARESRQASSDLLRRPMAEIEVPITMGSG